MKLRITKQSGIVSRQFSWVLVLVFFVFSLAYVISTPSPSAEIRTYSKLLSVTTQAFQQAIIYSHLQYQVKGKGKGAHQNLIEIAGRGLDYNSKGFPIGTSVDVNNLSLPVTIIQCRELWQTLLQPMRPYVAPEQDPTIQVETREGECVYRSKRFTNMLIRYQPETGQVWLQIIS